MGCIVVIVGAWGVEWDGGSAESGQRLRSTGSWNEQTWP